MARHCPECGFVVTEGANYCQRCGAYVGTREDTHDDATTATYMIDEQTGELRPVDVGDIAESTGATTHGAIANQRPIRLSKGAGQGTCPART